VAGSVLYITRRVAGTLVLGMLLREWIDFTTFALSEAAADAESPFLVLSFAQWGAFVLAIIGVVIVLRRGSHEPEILSCRWSDVTCAAALPDDDPVDDMVKVRFALDKDESGWPPAESEGLWAQPVAAGRFRLDNTPWFVRGVAADDVIEAESDNAGVWWFARVLERGGRVVVRVIPRRDGPLGPDRQKVLDAFASLGVSGEGMAAPVNMVALDIGPDAPVGAVKRLLEQGEADGRWHYEEGCVTDEWLRLA